jgi:hypothetical protein
MTTTVSSFYDPFLGQVSMNSAMMIRCLLHQHSINSDAAEPFYYATREMNNRQFLRFLLLNQPADHIKSAIVDIFDEHIDNLFSISNRSAIHVGDGDDGDSPIDSSDEDGDDDDEIAEQTPHALSYVELCRYATDQDRVPSHTVVYVQHQLIELYNFGHITPNVYLSYGALHSKPAFYYLLGAAGYYSDVL